MTACSCVGKAGRTTVKRRSRHAKRKSAASLCRRKSGALCKGSKRKVHPCGGTWAKKHGKCKKRSKR